MAQLLNGSLELGMSDGREERVQAYVSKQVLARLDQMAESLNWSRSQVAAKLLEIGTSGAPWIANRLATLAAGHIASALGKKQKGVGWRERKEGGE